MTASPTKKVGILMKKVGIAINDYYTNLNRRKIKQRGNRNI